MSIACSCHNQTPPYHCRAAMATVIDRALLTLILLMHAATESPLLPPQQGSGSSGGRTGATRFTARPLLHDAVHAEAPQQQFPALDPGLHAADPLVRAELGGAEQQPYHHSTQDFLQHGSYGGPANDGDFDADRGGPFAGPDHGFDIPGLDGDCLLHPPESIADSVVLPGWWRCHPRWSDAASQLFPLRAGLLHLIMLLALWQAVNAANRAPG